MRGINTRGNISLGADGCCPMVAVGATANNVFVNNKNPMIIGNYWGHHPCGGDHCGHGASCVDGNSTVLINGRPVVRSFSGLSCGDITGVGSPNVFVGS